MLKIEWISSTAEYVINHKCIKIKFLKAQIPIIFYLIEM